MLKFNLDKNVDLSFYQQIKGQLLSAIYCGKIQPGERLPPIRETAENLGVNYKTIRKVYLGLAAENLIEIVRGSGAFLQKRGGSDTYEEMRRRAIFKLLEEVVEKTRSLGLAPPKFARLLNDYLSGSHPRRLRLAVVDHQEEAEVFSRELRERTHSDVVPIPLTDRPDENDLAKLGACDYVLTTRWHLEQVERLALRYAKEVVEIKPRHRIYKEILEAARRHNVGIVIQDERTMHASWEIFMNLYHPTTEKKFWIAPLQRQDLVDKILLEADVVFVSPLCWDELRLQAPPGKALKTYRHFISDETIQLLRQRQLLG